MLETEGQKKRMIFVIPYYGKLPDYFDVWLRTVEYNREIDFLLITDLLESRKLPQNVKVLNWSFGYTREFIQKKFEFVISLETPYKFCDFKPTYGYIFEEYLVGYEFWGHCDVDCVFGDIYGYVEPYLSQYDVIGKYGHMALYRNTKDINEGFKKPGAAYAYDEVLANKEIYAFDEVSGVRKIYEIQKIRCLFELTGMADIIIAHKGMRICHGIKNYRKQVMIWENGKLYQCFENKYGLTYKEFAYLHFQKKNPIAKEELGNSFFILYDSFIPRKNISEDRELLCQTQKYHNKFFLLWEKSLWLIKKVKEMFVTGKKQRDINTYKRKYAKKKIIYK